MLVAVLPAVQARASADSPSRVTLESLRPGTVVVVGGFRFIVPERGRGVGAEALLAAGGERSASLTTLRDGRVVVRTDGSVTKAPLAPALPTDKCQDRAYALNTSVWRQTYRWSVRAGSVPAGVKRRSAEKAFLNAARSIVTGRNGCGIPDRISATERYMGRTKTRSDIGTSSNCQRADAKSVVSFGQIDPRDLALTCWWMRGGRSVEADVELNKADYRWTTNWGSGCVDSWSIQAVATHEFGHAFGLDHVSPILHPNQTMSSVIGPCQNSQATLGRGDVLGLRAKY